MARVKTGYTRRQRHKRLLKSTSGYRGTKSRLVKVAHEAQLHAGQYAFHGRKLKKRDMRSLWIIRVSEATKSLGVPYKDFMYGLKKHNIAINRKMLAELVRENFEAFKKIVNQAQGH
ncbi:MAG TPA: 50S ribosomal protein L20 [Patescibacteria group bacterium]|nr:50S ribosomal protein L20 [Patescibacteria group bacterium]